MKSPDTFVSVDIETTGLDPLYHEIIEIGAVKVENGKIIAEYSELVKPEKSIPEFITHLTGIRNSDVKNAGSIYEVIPSFVDFARGYKLLGHNVSFDIGFLLNFTGSENIGHAIDNLEIARILLPQLPSYSLDSLIEFFVLKPENRHRALDDARITAIIFLKLIDMLRLASTEFVNEILTISSKIGSDIKEVFEANIKERVAALSSKPVKIKSVLTAGIKKSNNIIGDFTGESVPSETGEAMIDPEYISSLLQEGGALSDHHSAYEERPGQIDLAKKIATAFNESEIMLAEAGTGIGKSIAYLIPAILWAETAHERVVISTNTKNLQEQLFTKDIPLLIKFLDFPFRAVILKGRGNYICLNRWKRIIDTPERYLSKGERGLLLPVASWLRETLTGDLSETGFYPLLLESGLLESINSDSPLCLGSRCKFRDQCFVNRVRKSAQRSHVIIVNHSLVFSDMVSDGGVLGDYNRIVFDEAHNIEKVALRFLGVTLSYYRVRRILNHLYSSNKGAHGLLVMLDGWVIEMAKGWSGFSANKSILESAIETVQKVSSSTSKLFESLYYVVREEAERSEGGHGGKHRYFGNSTIFLTCKNEAETFKGSLSELIGVLGDVIILLSSVSSNQLDTKEELMIEIEEHQGELQSIIDETDFLIEASGRNVFWFEYNESGTFYSLKIKSAPLDIAEKLAFGLYDRMETVVMTSATLSVANNFLYIRNRLGLNLDARDRVIEFIAVSPFDYKVQSMVVITSFLSSPKEDNFIRSTNDVLFSLAHDVNRGMLVLFTSRSHLQRSYYELKDRFTHNGITLIAQGIDGSRNIILSRFQKETGSVLFGTDSFWEGVDVPGNALELVVIVRLPFAVPTDPVIQAQMEEVEKAGGDPFMDFSVPEAAIKLRQGAGRLIRHRNDSGAVIIMDKRITTTHYGHLFRKSLPGTTVKVENNKMLVKSLNRWFDERQ